MPYTFFQFYFSVYAFLNILTRTSNNPQEAITVMSKISFYYHWLHLSAIRFSVCRRVSYSYDELFKSLNVGADGSSARVTRRYTPYLRVTSCLRMVSTHFFLLVFQPISRDDHCSYFFIKNCNWRIRLFHVLGTPTSNFHLFHIHHRYFTCPQLCAQDIQKNDTILLTPNIHPHIQSSKVFFVKYVVIFEL